MKTRQKSTGIPQYVRTDWQGIDCAIIGPMQETSPQITENAQGKYEVYTTLTNFQHTLAHAIVILFPANYIMHDSVTYIATQIYSSTYVFVKVLLQVHVIWWR